MPWGAAPEQRRPAFARARRAVVLACAALLLTSGPGSAAAAPPTGTIYRVTGAQELVAHQGALGPAYAWITGVVDAEGRGSWAVHALTTFGPPPLGGVAQPVLVAMRDVFVESLSLSWAPESTYLAAWVEHRAGTGGDLVVIPLDPGGSPAGPAQVVATGATCATHARLGGNALVAWVEVGASGGPARFLARLIGPTGEPASPSVELGTASIDSFGPPACPDVAVSPVLRTFLVAWAGDDVRVARLDEAGALRRVFVVAPLGPSAPPRHEPAAIAVGPDHQALVAWRSGIDARRWPEIELLGRALDPSGRPRGAGPTRLTHVGRDRALSASPHRPDLAALGEGTYILVWDALEAPGGAPLQGVYGQLLGPRGRTSGRPFAISPRAGDGGQPAGTATTPRLAPGPLGLVTWVGPSASLFGASTDGLLRSIGIR